jgi:acetyltransferase-like isoleucine patch superfamily enzyme
VPIPRAFARGHGKVIAQALHVLFCPGSTVNEKRISLGRSGSTAMGKLVSSTSDFISRAERSASRIGESPGASDKRSSTTVRKVLKVLKSPRLALALINAQLSIRGKARPPLSVRLTGRIRLRGDGDVEFGHGVTLTGDIVPIEFVSYGGGRISIGDHTFVNYGSSISAYDQVNIGRQCLIGHHALIVDRNEHGVEQRDVVSPPAPVTIEDHVWIGSRVIILPGVSIGRHSVIGAGSVVTKDIPANCLAVGNPARVVRRFRRAA